MLIVLSGRATRLLFELGLHKDARELQASHMTQMDLEVRQAVFLGCFLYDRFVLLSESVFFCPLTR